MKHGPDVLFVNPGGRRRIYQRLADDLSAVEPPIWAGLLASAARARGRDAAILDANALELDERAAAAGAVAIGARLTVVVVYGHNPSASTQVMPAAGAFCRAFKELAPERPLLLVGGHVAALPERTLREEAADFVCDGEGPHTIEGLLRWLESAGGARSELARVPGLLWREGGRIARSAPAPLVLDLAREMPGVAFDLMPMERYRAHNWQGFDGSARRPYAALYTTLGCPFRCGFCCIQAPFRSGERALGYKPNANSYRRWPASLVAETVARLEREYGITTFKFADELFVLDPKHVRAVCERLIELGGERNIWAYARVDTAENEELLAMMRAAGFRWLALGIESASARVRDDVAKGYREDRIERAVERIRRAGIHVLGNYIFGLPEDDLASMQATLDLALALRTEFANFNCAMAYPGSKLYERALAEGWPLPDDWTGYSQYARSTRPLPTKHVDGATVLRFRDEAFRRYFGDPGYRAHLARVFGPRAVAEVERMTAVELPRDLAPAGA